MQTILRFKLWPWLCLLAFLGVSTGAWGQVLTDDFPNDGLLTANGWTQVGTGGTTGNNPINTSTQNLTLTGLTTRGNSATLTTSGQDVSRGFTAQTSGSMCASCRVIKPSFFSAKKGASGFCSMHLFLH